MSWSERLAELGITLPEVVPPLAAYVPATRHGDLIYTAGQLPIVDGELRVHGKVSETAEGVVHVDTAVELARLCALNGLAAIDSLVGIDHVERVVKVTGFVASAPGFSAQAAVLNGASLLLGEIFGDAGRHVRSAVGVAELPLGAPVEVELVVAVH
ncbi:RidA family protein [Tsukamurella sp. 8F]|uniref:RidA family protein n=1 Tax=unclassified Tsukamurella TaxID=2633480 RepID=UPI0023B96EA2|nr:MULTISPECIES: RidA family protein [unclassified Tsukamurella]MDF0529611.1 RidA family protein [Tsukamurella sp. 8J]MDF0585701.1 RidA family protein [Tsukamurella sp. 8F]